MTAWADRLRISVGERRRLLPAYLRVGLLLHVITLMEITLLTLIGSAFPILTADSRMDTAVNGMVLSFLASLPILSQLDARSRYQSYKRVKDQIFRYGFDPRILKPFLKSRCQRDAAWVAADELGYGTLCRNYYRAQGYRWYHILPDFIFSNPRFLISGRFWQSTFFMKTYRPRFNTAEENS